MNFPLMFGELLNHGVTYASVTLLDHEGQSYYFKCSSDNWLQVYILSGLYQKCHLMHEAQQQFKFHHQGFILVWDNYAPKNAESLYLNQLRQEKNICHGVSFCNSLDQGRKSVITVTGKYMDINFAFNIIKNKQKIYRSLMRSFSKGLLSKD